MVVAKIPVTTAPSSSTPQTTTNKNPLLNGPLAGNASMEEKPKNYTPVPTSTPVPASTAASTPTSATKKSSGGSKKPVIPLTSFPQSQEVPQEKQTPSSYIKTVKPVEDKVLGGLATPLPQLKPIEKTETGFIVHNVASTQAPFQTTAEYKKAAPGMPIASTPTGGVLLDTGNIVFGQEAQAVTIREQERKQVVSRGIGKRAAIGAALFTAGVGAEVTGASIAAGSAGAAAVPGIIVASGGAVLEGTGLAIGGTAGAEAFTLKNIAPNYRDIAYSQDFVTAEKAGLQRVAEYEKQRPFVENVLANFPGFTLAEGILPQGVKNVVGNFGPVQTVAQARQMRQNQFDVGFFESYGERADTAEAVRLAKMLKKQRETSEEGLAFVTLGGSELLARGGNLAFKGAKTGIVGTVGRTAAISAGAGGVEGAQQEIIREVNLNQPLNPKNIAISGGVGALTAGTIQIPQTALQATSKPLGRAFTGFVYATDPTELTADLVADVQLATRKQAGARSIALEPTITKKGGNVFSFGVTEATTFVTNTPVATVTTPVQKTVKSPVQSVPLVPAVDVFAEVSSVKTRVPTEARVEVPTETITTTAQTDVFSFSPSIITPQTGILPPLLPTFDTGTSGFGGFGGRQERKRFVSETQLGLGLLGNFLQQPVLRNRKRRGK